jgi:hypothetical protein
LSIEISNNTVLQHEIELKIKNCHSTISENVKEFYFNLPEKSKIRSSAIQTFFKNMDSSDASEILDISIRRINQARSIEVNEIWFYLKELGFMRQRARETILHGWLEEFAPYESGRDKRYFTWTGDLKLMYSKYILHFKADPGLTYGIKKFSEVISHERIGIHSGDVFFDSVKIKYNRMKEQKKQGHEVDEVEFKQLEEQYTFNNERKTVLKNFISNLKGNKNEILFILDFSQLQMSLTNKFHTFVVVLISDEMIEIPDALRDFFVKSEKPETMTEIPEDQEITMEKRKRRRNKEKVDKIPKSFNDQLYKMKKEKHLSTPEIQIQKYSPFHLHLHFAMRQTSETPGQIAPFVQHCGQILFNSGNI